MTPAEVQSGLQSVFDKVFRRSDIVVRADLTAADVPGWDSFRYVSLIMATEEHFHIKLSDFEIDELHNVGDLLRLITHKLRPEA